MKVEREREGPEMVKDRWRVTGERERERCDGEENNNYPVLLHTCGGGKSEKREELKGRERERERERPVQLSSSLSDEINCIGDSIFAHSTETFTDLSIS